MGDYNNPYDNNNQSNDGNPDQQQNGQPGYQQYNQDPYQNNQYQYGQYQQYQTPDQPQSNGMAVGSLICGILGILLSCCLWYIAIPLAIAGLVLGILVVKNRKGGRNLAIAGIVLSSISIVLAIIVVICVIIVFTNPEFSSLYQELLQNFDTTF